MEAKIGEIWVKLFGADFQSGAISGFVNAMMPDVITFAGALAFISIAYHVLLYMADIQTKLDPFVIIRPAIVLLAVITYSELVNLLINIPTEIFTAIIESGTATIPGNSPKAFDDAISYVDITTGAGTGDGIFDILAVNPFLELLHMIVYFASTLVAVYMLFRQLIIVAIYYVIGPFAVAFSLVIGNKHAVKNWYFGFLSVMFWTPLIKIMQGIIVAISPSTIVTGGFTNGLFMFVLQLVMIYSMLQIPKYASILVSKGSEAGASVGSTVAGSVGRMVGIK